jgi:hypothetical protein
MTGLDPPTRVHPRVISGADEGLVSVLNLSCYRYGKGTS